MAEITQSSYASDVAEELELTSAAYAGDVAGEVDAGNVSGQEMAAAINEREQGDYTLRVCSFNIGHFNQGKHGVDVSDINSNKSDGYPYSFDRNYSIQLGRWNRFIGGVNADIIGMPEWSTYFGWNNGVRVPVANTGIFSGYSLSVGDVAYSSGNMWQNTLATKGITLTGDHDEQLVTGLTALKAYVRVGTAQIAGHSVKVGVTHLHLNDYRDARMAEISMLVDMFKNEQYVILCGDFNTRPVSGDEINGLHDFDPFYENGFTLANYFDNPLMTFAATGGRPDLAGEGHDQPFVYIDNIIVKGFTMDINSVKVLNLDAFNTPGDPLDVGMLSDHCAVVADLTIIDNNNNNNSND